MSQFIKAVELVNTQTIPLKGIQRVSIRYISESIMVYQTDGEDLILKEYFNSSDADVFADIAVERDSVSIRHGDRPILFNVLRGYVEVYLPKGYYGILNMMTVSGKIESQAKLALSDLAVSSTSGAIYLGDVTAGAAVLSTISGKISVASLKALANVRSTSGSIYIGHAAGAGEYKTTSGKIEASYSAVVGNIAMQSTSGRICLEVPAGLSFTVDAHSISGKINLGFPARLSVNQRNAVSGTVGEPPYVQVRLGTVSGKIEIGAPGCFHSHE